MDWETIHASVRKTGRLLVLDTGAAMGSIGGEIIARVCMNCFRDLKQAPQRIALPDYPTPTSFSLTKHFYRGAKDIIRTVAEMLNKKIKIETADIGETLPHDVPGDWFKGPF
jgi:pyruvate dehydrogenase E1 component beta subunit